MLICLCMVFGTVSCQKNQPAQTGAEATEDNAEENQKSQVATAEEMTYVVDVVEDWMVPIPGSAVKDGVYPVTVDSSSAMFKIEEAKLTVQGGKMSVVMTMGGTGYLYLFMGTGEEAAAASFPCCSKSRRRR